MLPLLAPVGASQDMKYEDKSEERLMMFSSVFLSHGLPYKSQETLFKRGASALRAVQHIGNAGLGTDKTIASNVSKAVMQLEIDHLRPQMRMIATHKLPLAILMDGSAHKGGGRGEAELVGVHCPMFNGPQIVDWKSLPKSPDAEKLDQVATDAATGKVTASGLYITFGEDGLLGKHDVREAVAVAAAGAAATVPAPAAAAPAVESCRAAPCSKLL